MNNYCKLASVTWFYSKYQFTIHQGNNGVGEGLNWRTRVRIVVEAAQGMVQQNDSH